MALRHPWNRLLAWLIDWLCILVWVAIVAAVGGILYATGVTRAMDPVSGNIVGFVTLIVPVTLALAWRESSARGATPGKRSRRLRVVASSGDGSRVSFRRALLRSVLKVALPWELGHTVVFTLVSSPNVVPVWIVPVAALAYALPIVYVVTLFVGDGRTLYDRVAGTTVVLANGMVANAKGRLPKEPPSRASF
jgi:uncharacterized RDD family membrane protein YckC